MEEKLDFVSAIFKEISSVEKAFGMKREDKSDKKRQKSLGRSPRASAADDEEKGNGKKFVSLFSALIRGSGKKNVPNQPEEKVTALIIVHFYKE
jgi:hypothetical protein